jgi:hypothetical protein
MKWRSLLDETERAMFAEAKGSLRSLQSVYKERCSVYLAFDSAEVAEVQLSLDQADLLNLVEACEVHTGTLQRLITQLQKEWAIVSSLSDPQPDRCRRCTATYLARLEEQLGELQSIHASNVQRQTESLASHRLSLEGARSSFEEACSAYGAVQEAVVAAAQECAQLYQQLHDTRGTAERTVKPLATSSMQKNTATRCAHLSQRLWSAYQRYTQTASHCFNNTVIAPLRSRGNDEAGNVASLALGDSETLSFRDGLHELQRRADRLLAVLRHNSRQTVKGDTDDTAVASVGDHRRVDGHTNRPVSPLAYGVRARSPHSGDDRRSVRERGTAGVRASDCDAAAFPSHNGAVMLSSQVRTSAATQTKCLSKKESRDGGLSRPASSSSLPVLEAWEQEHVNARTASPHTPSAQGDESSSWFSSLKGDAEAWRARLSAIQARLSRSVGQAPTRTENAEKVQRRCLAAMLRPPGVEENNSFLFSVPRRIGAERRCNLTTPSLPPSAPFCGDGMVEVNLLQPSCSSDACVENEPLLCPYQTDGAMHMGVAAISAQSAAYVPRRTPFATPCQPGSTERRSRDVDALILQLMREQLKRSLANLVNEREQ